MKSRRRHGLAALICVALLSAGCASNSTGLGYYWQSVTGHLSLMQVARPVDDWLADETAPPALKERLEKARLMRQFSVSELALPDNASYRRYADLKRRAAVYNVVAAPALSLKLQTWCFPVAGCVGYRGYFLEADARAFANSLGRELEVTVYPVPAYSTLGWMNWAGGDPLLSTFINYPEGELARMVFHELAHQVVYVQNDTAFNESFATTALKTGWAGYAGYDPFVARANNASFAAQAAYDQWVPAFEALFEREGRSFVRFYDAVRALADRPKDERTAALRALAPNADMPAQDPDDNHRP
jgi:predicted aminopeptidase